MPDNLLDLPLLLQILQCLPCNRAIDLHAIDECSDGDETVRLDIFVEALDGLLVEDDSVVRLVLDCTGVSLCRRLLTSQSQGERCRMQP